MELYYFHTLKALWDGLGKIKLYYGKSRVKRQLSGKRSILECQKHAKPRQTPLICYQTIVHSGYFNLCIQRLSHDISTT